MQVRFQEKQKQQQSPIVCYNCNGNGHIARNCPKGSGTGSDRSNSTGKNASSGASAVANTAVAQNTADAADIQQQLQLLLSKFGAQNVIAAALHASSDDGQ